MEEIGKGKAMSMAQPCLSINKGNGREICRIDLYPLKGYLKFLSPALVSSTRAVRCGVKTDPEIVEQKME